LKKSIFKNSSFLWLFIWLITFWNDSGVICFLFNETFIFNDFNTSVKYSIFSSLGTSCILYIISVEQTGESEKMIEDFMVRANEEVAKFITDLKLPMMYRIH
ncbi:RNB domain-containing ribonuclease, partial [Mycoplasmopsis bovis]|uniref:RNB domain-containing ribonuclease n=1 Tax=Mycoplasmopsis bovis TaxID=28903 RepID=UPI003D2E1D0F